MFEFVYVHHMQCSVCVFAFITWGRPDTGHSVFVHRNITMCVCVCVCCASAVAVGNECVTRAKQAALTFLFNNWLLQMVGRCRTQCDPHHPPRVTRLHTYSTHIYTNTYVSEGRSECELCCVTVAENKHVSASCVCSNRIFVSLGSRLL